MIRSFSNLSLPTSPLLRSFNSRHSYSTPYSAVLHSCQCSRREAQNNIPWNPDAITLVTWRGKPLFLLLLFLARRGTLRTKTSKTSTTNHLHHHQYGAFSLDHFQIDSGSTRPRRREANQHFLKEWGSWYYRWSVRTTHTSVSAPGNWC